MKITTYNTVKNNNTFSISNNDFIFTDDLPLMRKIAKEIQQRFSTIFIFGVGGSSLAGQLLIKFHSVNAPHIEFIDVVDETEMVKIKRSNINETAFIFITKSGETLETITQMNYCIQHLYGQNKKLYDHCYVITMQDTPLWNFAIQNNITKIIHPNISGRFSCFTSVAIFPALIAGVDVENYIQGGIEQFAQKINTSFSETILDKPIHVIMPYIHRLEKLTEWHSQLITETLGKDGNGYAVLRCLGTKDQHNQLQMFLDGKNDKTYTFIGCTQCSGEEIPNFIPEIQIPKTTLCTIIQGGMYGIIEKLSEQKKTVRFIEFNEITPKEVGKLFAFFMQEVLFQAQMLNVVPFVQPAVASVKELMFEYINTRY